MDNLTRREEINLHEAVQKSFPKILIKDLTEHERICPVCNGSFASDSGTTNLTGASLSWDASESSATTYKM